MKACAMGEICGIVELWQTFETCFLLLLVTRARAAAPHRPPRYRANGATSPSAPISIGLPSGATITGSPRGPYTGWPSLPSSTGTCPDASSRWYSSAENSPFKRPPPSAPPAPPPPPPAC